MLLLLGLAAGGGGAACAATATIDPAGFVRVDDAPFFPLGIYHVSWIGDRQGAPAVPDLHAIADAGFNLVHPTVDLRPDMAALLDAAAARGVYVIAEIGWGGSTAVIDRWKASPAILGWNVADDFNAPRSGPPNHPPAEVADRQAVIRALDPGRLTYGSGGAFPGFSIMPYVGTMDVMGFQIYPIDSQTYDAADELQETIDSFDYVAAQLAGTGQVFVATPQAFAWRSQFPTPREERNIVYGSLVRGAKGVLWYTFWGENGVLPAKNPTLWMELQREIRELRTLAPFLLFGARTAFVTGHPRVHGAWWSHEGQIVAVLLNTHRSESVPVTLPLPAGAGTPHALFPTRSEGGMTLAGGALTGAIGPEQVHAYLLDVVPPGAVAPVPAIGVGADPAALGEPIGFDASASYDPDGTVASVAWDFGDGTTASGAIVTHAFATLGTHHVRVTIRDADGVPATAFVPVAVEVTGLCGTAPAPGCVEGSAGQLKLTRPNAAKRTLLWRWSRGPIPPAALGDPSAGTDVALCLWDATGKRLATGVPAGAPGWRLGAGGFRYGDRAGAPAGLVSARIVASDTAAGSALWKGKGSALPDPALPLVPPVAVQLRTTAGGCWSSTFTAGAVQTNTATAFRAAK